MRAESTGSLFRWAFLSLPILMYENNPATKALKHGAVLVVLTDSAAANMLYLHCQYQVCIATMREFRVWFLEICCVDLLEAEYAEICKYKQMMSFCLFIYISWPPVGFRESKLRHFLQTHSGSQTGSQWPFGTPLTSSIR